MNLRFSTLHLPTLRMLCRNRNQHPSRWLFREKFIYSNSDLIVFSTFSHRSRCRFHWVRKWTRIVRPVEPISWSIFRTPGTQAGEEWTSTGYTNHSREISPTTISLGCTHGHEDLERKFRATGFLPTSRKSYCNRRPHCTQCFLECSLQQFPISATTQNGAVFTHLCVSSVWIHWRRILVLLKKK